MGGVVACFGEVMLRYGPGAGRTIEQADSFEIFTGGAEANVAVALANLGRPTRLISALPDNSLGTKARKDIASHGVDISHMIRREGRMGCYVYTPPAGGRSGDVIYDREGSAFALVQSGDFDPDAVLDGASHLHLSGISLALSKSVAQITLDLAHKAKDAGMTLSFDGNFRPALWGRTTRVPREWIQPLVEVADLMFGNHKDVALLLDQDFSGDGPDRRREAALALIEAFPNIHAVASTARHIDEGRIHRIIGRIDTKENCAQSDEWRIADITDRIGTGDAFAAGVLHGWLDASEALDPTIRTAMALMAVKHATWGDFSLADSDDVARMAAGQTDVRR